VVHVLKRSVGIGGKGATSVAGVNGALGKVQMELEDRIDELVEAFMLLITATDFLDVSITAFL
jgi:nuclear pore complex protein Nup205